MPSATALRGAGPLGRNAPGPADDDVRGLPLACPCPTVRPPHDALVAGEIEKAHS